LPTMPPPELSFAKHDHEGCKSHGLDAVAQDCAAKGLRLTASRRLVLEILLADHRALGAYDILDEMAKHDQPAQPPIVYRALDFLVAHGFAHKIEHLNAFLACGMPGRDHAPAFLVCQSCRKVAEAPVNATDVLLDRVAADSGFIIEHTVIEAFGLCPACQKEDTCA